MNDRYLTSGWFDFRAWWRLRGLLVREPERSLDGAARNGYTPRGFARFLWIILPTALIGLLAGVAALQPDRPESSYEMTARLAEALREETLAAAPPPARADAGEAKLEPLEWRTALVLLELNQPLAAEQRDATATRYRATLEAHRAALSPAQFERQKARLADRLRATERKLRWMDRLQESGLSNLFGFLFVGLLLPVIAGSFRWMVGRMIPPAVHADRAGDVYLYAVIARLAPWHLLSIGFALLYQAGIAFQVVPLVNTGLVGLLAVSLPLLVAHYRAGPMVARVLTGEEADVATGRRYSWRLVGVFMVTQLVAAVWVGVFTFAIEVLAHMP